jgi:hypothetical protein
MAERGEIPDDHVKLVISIEETPEEFIAAMQSQYYDADQAAFDYLME